MRLLVLVPSPETKSSAGARIRYQRMARPLLAEGIELTLEDIGGFDPVRADFDALLISKCYDARSMIAACAAADRGKLVGIDLFDDYFSQETDARLVRHRSWLSQIVENCAFALCSTEAMANTVFSRHPDVPVHIMNDPASLRDPDNLAAVLTEKAAAARDNGRLSVVWFGVGDNPYFQVGLRDVAAWGAALSELTRSAMALELTILTNRRALNPEGLSLIATLPVPVRTMEWTEAAERDALRAALLAFLPVSAQPFSIAKSLNRAVTALSSGCQVLSVGYPIYAALDPLIYRDSSSLLADLAGGSLRLSASTVWQLLEKIKALASAPTEAQRLATFLAQISSPAGKQTGSLVLVHGQSTRTDAHQFIRRVNGLSIASPYCTAPLDFDVIFRRTAAQLDMLVSLSGAQRLIPEARRRLHRNAKRGRFAGEQYRWLPTDGSMRTAPTFSRSEPERLPVQLATYTTVMSEVLRRTADVFGPCRTIVSETAPLPFPALGSIR